MAGWRFVWGPRGRFVRSRYRLGRRGEAVRENRLQPGKKRAKSIFNKIRTWRAKGVFNQAQSSNDARGAKRLRGRGRRRARALRLVPSVRPSGE